MKCKYCGKEIKSFNKKRKRCFDCVKNYPAQASSQNASPYKRKEEVEKK